MFMVFTGIEATQSDIAGRLVVPAPPEIYDNCSQRLYTPKQPI
jgi:hypothetical protein